MKLFCTSVFLGMKADYKYRLHCEAHHWPEFVKLTNTKHEIIWTKYLRDLQYIMILYKLQKEIQLSYSVEIQESMNFQQVNKRFRC